MKLLNICPLCHRGFIGDENRRENGDQPFVKSTIPILNAEQSEEVLKDQDSFADFIKVGFEICEHPCYDCKEIAEKKFKRIMNYFEESKYSTYGQQREFEFLVEKVFLMLFSEEQGNITPKNWIELYSDYADQLCTCSKAFPNKPIYREIPSSHPEGIEFECIICKTKMGWV